MLIIKTLKKCFSSFFLIECKRQLSTVILNILFNSTANNFRCDSCPNPYAEVTLRGCEVVYDGCPRSYAGGLWWPRTKFGQEAVESCPLGSQGKKKIAEKILKMPLTSLKLKSVKLCSLQAKPSVK